MGALLGKKKAFLLPLITIIAFILPLTLPLVIAYFVNRKVQNKKGKFIIFLVLVLVVLTLATILAVRNIRFENTFQNQLNSSSTSPTSERPLQLQNSQKITFARVVRVIDGDTIEVDLGSGDIKIVRYIGINTPESSDTSEKLQCFGREATSKNKSLVENKIVGLEKDISEVDKYGRLLRYVYVGDLMINRKLIEEGYAYHSFFHPDVKYQDEFEIAERYARNNYRGLWSKCTEEQGRFLSSSPPSLDYKEKSYGQNCKYSCSGTDKDCSDFSSQSDAQNFFECCKFTADNDPMRLDGIETGDGVACENL